MTQDPLNVRTQLSFGGNIAALSLSHLLELMLMLQSYREGLVIVGGWAPYLILAANQTPGTDFQHAGSIDIDVAIDPVVVNETEYATLEKLLTDRGYEQKPDSTYSYVKKVQVGDMQRDIVVDFLAPYEGGTSNSHRHQRIQNDFLARKARGADLAFRHRFEYTLRGTLPNGADASVSFYVADIVAIMAMKSYVLGQRYKEKDAYDIYALLVYYKNGISAVAEEMRPFITEDPLPEGIENLRSKFASQNEVGSVSVADFMQETGAEHEQRAQQAYLQVQGLLEMLGQDK